MLCVSTIGGVIGWATASQFDWNTVKPTWWLLADADDPIAGKAALIELDRRLGDGSLSALQVNGIVDRAIKLQADWSKPWPVEWGNFIDTARNAGLVDDERWKRYIKQGIQFEIVVRPKVHANGIVPVLARHKHRLSNNTDFWIRAKTKSFAIGSAISRDFHGRGWGASGSGGGGTSTKRFSLNRLEQPLEPGEYPIKYELGLKVSVGFAQDAPVVHEWDVEFADKVQIVDANAQTVTLVRDPSLQQQVKAALSVRSFRIRNGDRSSPSLVVDVNNSPVDVAFEVFIDDGQQDVWSMGSIYVKKNIKHGWHVSKGENPIFELPATVDLIFKPSVESAKSSVDIFKIWGEEVVVEDVPVSP